MASSGSTSVNVTDWDTLKFSWSQKSQNVANNTTTISWKLELIATSYGYINSSASKAWNVTVNGTKYSGTTSVGINNNSTKTLASGTTTISHNADGSKAFDYSFSQVFDIDFNGKIGTISGSGSGTLNTIPRASQPSCITWPNHTQNVGSFGDTISIHMNRASDAFTHTVRYKFGTNSGTIATGVGTGTTWTIPKSLMALIPSALSGSGTIYVDTYNGSTSIGTKSCGFTATVPSDEDCYPKCSMTLEDITGVDDIYGSPVQNLSKIKVTTSTTPAYGSPIASYSISIDGVKYTAAEATTGALKTAGNSNVTVVVKDKRGRLGSAVYTMKVQAYTPPSVPLLSVHRCDASGKEDDQGEYINAKFSATISPMGNKNTAAYTLRYKKSTDTQYTEVNMTGYAGVYELNGVSYLFAADSNYSYDVEVVATDAHKSTIRATSASTAFSLIDFHSSGNALRFGGVAEEQHTFQNDLSLKQTGNRYAFSTPGVANQAGAICMARIKVTAANADTPITFVFSRRQAESTMTVHVRLVNSTATTSSVGSVRYEGSNYGAYLTPGGNALTWDLYVSKGSQWDTVTLQDWWTSKAMESRVEVTFPGGIVDAVPEPYWRAGPLIAESILDCFFPVGFVLTLYSHADPNEMYPGSTWVRITNRFLWACDADGAIGTIGGEKTHTLTANELPSHRHSITVASTAAGSVSVGDTVRYNGSATSYKGTLYTENTGGGAAHNNMPPYIQVSMWRRTA